MAKRRMRGGWIVVAIATLLLSVSLVLSETPLLQEPPAVTIGTSRVGDIAVYDTFQEYVVDQGGPGEERQDRKLVWSVLPVADKPDSSGALHRSIGLSADSFDPSQTRSRTNSITTMWIDEENRQPVRREFFGPRSFSRPVTRDLGAPAVDLNYTVHENSTSILYYALWNPIQIQDGYQPALLLAFLQGQTIALGDNVGQPIVEPLTSWVDCCSGERYDFSMHVTREGVWNGERVLAVHMYAHELYRAKGYRQDSPFDYASWSNATFWFRDGSPYPVRLDWDYSEWWLNLDDTVEWNRVRGGQWLVELRAGSEPVRWGEFDPQDVPARVPTLLQGPLPQTGGKSPFAYPLESALRNIENDPTLLEFRLWRAQNPQARVSGVHMDPRNAQPLLGQSWRIGFATDGSQEVFTVKTTMDAAGRVTNQIVGSQKCRPGESFDFRAVPAQFVTLAEVDALWRTVASREAQGAGANHFWWGMAQCGTDRAVGSLLYIVYGRWTEVARQNALLRDRHADLLLLSAFSGYLYEGVIAEQRVASAPGVQGLSSQPAPPAAPTSRSSDVSPIAVASAGLSLLLLLAYVYPVAQQGVFTLYSKLVRSQLLDHELRDQLIHLIRENPGVSPPHLKRATGAAWTTVIYHLGVLRDNGLITSVRDGRHRRYFPIGILHHSQLRGAAVLQNARTREVRDLIRAQPGIDRPALARLMGVTPAAVSWHLKRLLGAGHVRAEGRGRIVRYYAAASVESAALSPPLATP